MAAVAGRAAGHPNIRATHAKTLELSRDAEIGERATCVVGVAVELDEQALAAGAESVVVRGRLNPAFEPGDPLVVRRAPDVTRNAVIVDADTVAADVPRSFVALLANSSSRIAARVEELADETAPGVLVVDPRRAIRAQDRPVAEMLARGERVTVGADETSVIAAAHEAGHTVLPAPSLPLRDAVQAVAGTADAELMHGVPAERVAKLLRTSGAARAVIALDHGTPREQYLHWRAGETPQIPGARGRTATLALVQPGSAPETTTVSRPEPRTSR
jgi:hypothetical protein